MGDYPSKNHLIDEMLAAINASMNYLEKHGGSSYFLKNGSFEGEVQGNNLYQFSTDYLDEIPDDTDIELRINGKSSDGKIYSIDSLEKIVQVSLSEYIGKSIPEAKLIVTNGYLLKLLVDRLTEVKDNKISLSDLCIKILYPQTAKVGYRDVSIQSNELDEYKIDAIKHALGSELSYVWGPPGTGKTTMLSKVIQQLMEDNQSILLLSHTNVATDKVLSSFIDKTNYDLEMPENIGSIIRLGTHPSDEIKDKIEYLGLKQVVGKKLLPIQKEILRLESEILNLKNQLSAIDKDLIIFEQIDKKTKELNEAHNKLERFENDYQSLMSKQKENETAISEIEQRISDYQNAGFFSRLFSGVSLESLIDKKTALINSRENIQYKLNKVVNEATRVNSNIALLNNFFKTTKEPNTSKVELTNKVAQLNAEIDKIEKEIAGFRKKLEEIEATVISEAKMIVSTLSNAYVSKPLLGRSYDCVIVDEVSMAPIPALFFAAGLAKNKVVLVGDFCQLPPIAQYRVDDDDGRSEEEKENEKRLVNKWLLQDIFKHSGTEDIVRNGGESVWLKQLKRQYRMHPDIANAVNEIMYSQFGNNYKLESDDLTFNKGVDFINNEPIPGARVAIINTEQSKTRESRTRSGSYYNLYSAILSVSIAETAINSGFKNVGIISPFRPQANLLQKMLKDKNWDNKIIDADTVHRFQGEERDLIIFDLTTSFPTILTDDGTSGGNDEKLINVALSRAKSKCILICDAPKVETTHSASSAILKFVKLCRAKNYPIIDSQALLKNDVFTTEEEWLSKIHGLGSMDDVINGAEATDEKDFYQKFCRDLLAADREIIIDSPFTTKDRCEYLKPFFEHALRKGVKIYVITRLPSDQNGAMKEQTTTVINDFENMGIVVLPFKGLPHRKLAIIDRRVLWLGSLNILSQRNSQEIMFRTEGNTTCDQLLSFLRFDKNVGKMGEEPKLIRCEFCNKPGAWYWTDVGRFGLWTFCLVGSHKRGKPPKTEEEIRTKKNEVHSKRKQQKQYSSNGKPLCSDHNIEMVLKKGRYGEFWGCPEYPKCKVTEQIKRYY